MLEITDAHVRFGGAHVLRGVSVTVERGRIHGLLGPNGSGKTTLLNAISGFVPCTGSITLDGEQLHGLPAHRRTNKGLGRTFQNPKAPDDMTVADLLRLGEHQLRTLPWHTVAFRPWKTAREQRLFAERCAQALTSVGLSPGLLDQELGTIASGDLKMIDIARALMSRPHLLALDEPTSGMNDEEIDILLARLKALRETGLTVLIVEHNVRVVTEICDQVTVLAAGGILAEGPPREVFRRTDVIDAYLGEADGDSPDPAGSTLEKTG
ncbi:ABC transporter ATP-binding protein [Amycolatopsis jejuensis]|uniref:ABC transporter ATP-binding protein n=1 Tax=Amycolatopsis jejuensis TaxID=330084 RepID=UPI00068AB433|nr:ABC transporter ATP-binding protein [Amycolatopsis jejuensis]